MNTKTSSGTYASLFGVLIMSVLLGVSSMSEDELSFFNSDTNYHHGNNWNGDVDRGYQIAEGGCTAFHKPSRERLTLVKSTMQRGGIMVLYKVKEFGGNSSFYATSFTDFECK